MKSRKRGNDGLKNKMFSHVLCSRLTQVVKLLTPITELSIKIMGRLSQVRMQDLGSAVPPGTPESCPNGNAITASEEGRRLVRLRMERLFADCGPCRSSQEG